MNHHYNYEPITVHHEDNSSVADHCWATPVHGFHRPTVFISQSTGTDTNIIDGKTSSQAARGKEEETQVKEEGSWV